MYVLKMVQQCRRDKNPIISKTADGLFVILIMIATGWILRGRDMLNEFPVWGQIALLSVFLLVKSHDKQISASIPMELRFYDNHIEIHRYGIIFQDGKTGRDFIRFEYEDILACSYHQKRQLLVIKGKGHSERQQNAKDGRLKRSAEISDSTYICRFRIDPHVDIVSEIKEHSPIKVRVTKK